MQVKLAYLGRSGLRAAGAHAALSLSPNLAREPVAFDAAIRQPLRFREAVSALHDVVISDLRFKKKDKTAYLEWKKRQAEAESSLRREAHRQATARAMVRHDVPGDFQRQYDKLRGKYWNARQSYSDYLRKHDMELWRLLMPCDPVITVAEDVVFLECFSADESSYGCLTVNREDGFGHSHDLRLGTTNVDYSWELYHHFQSLRSYRETRFRVDPAGFELAAVGGADYREEKIDLPGGWLSGFMQIQAAMTLPMTHVRLGREAVYSILAYLKRHRRETSPRGLRFELSPGAVPKLVLEPWEVVIPTHGSPVFEDSPTAPIRIWGRRRLLSLARLLPLAEGFDVYLLGTGLPSFWVARLGEMRLTVGLSGWTTNDWTRASAMDLVAQQVQASPDQAERLRECLQRQRAMTLHDLSSQCMVEAPAARSALMRLARTGQVIHDLGARLYRWRQIMPQALGEAELSQPHPELAAARDIMARKEVRLESQQPAPGGGVVLSGNIDNTPVEMMLDGDRNVKRGKCVCGHYRKYLLRNGPCRHMIVLRKLWQMREGE